MITVNHVSKVYHLYDSPSDRLKESLDLRKKSYHRKFSALHDLSFSIEKGDTVGIVGTNGSGKSTLLKMITGVLTPTEGEILVDGRIAAILELGAGFNPELTGRENIFLNGTLQGFSKAEIKERIPRILAFADIGDFIDRPVKTYSSGMFSRLAFAVSINVDPDVLIVDEALAVGDMKFQTKCFNRFRELREQGVTILFVGHDVGSIRKFCNKVLWLHEGKMVRYGDTIEVTAKYMEYMMKGEGEPFDFTFSDEKETTRSEEQTITPLSSKKMEVITRWGSEQGLIQHVETQNVAGYSDHFDHGETMNVIVHTKMPAFSDLEHVSVAVSIKDKSGTDLIVTTTHDGEIRFNDASKTYVVEFSIPLYLTEGEYYLAVCVENREYDQPAYYDFIEGTGYFRIFQTTKFFGLFHPPIHQKELS